MPSLPSSAVQYYCEGGCEQLFSNFHQMIAHRRGKNADCKQAGHRIVYDDDTAAAPAEAPAGDEPPPASDEPPPDTADGAEKPATTPVRAVTAYGASTTKEQLYLPASYRALYDAFVRQFRYRGTYNDWVMESLADYSAQCGLQLVVIVGPPKAVGLTPEPVKAEQTDGATPTPTAAGR